jgi:XTP/dITP diphosphohydrolase
MMQMAILLVGTGNAHKLAEIQAILADLPLEVRGAEHLPAPVEVVESGETFEENARLKALAFARAAAGLPQEERPRWVIADDSGLCVDALGGEPGVRSARYAGGKGSSLENNRKLLGALQGLEPGNRTARFVCVIACAEPAEGGGEPGILFEARGECAGRIAEAPRGHGGFGYDPLFLIPERGLTYAELGEEEKNRLSHRGRALARFRERLAGRLAAASGKR